MTTYTYNPKRILRNSALEQRKIYREYRNDVQRIKAVGYPSWQESSLLVRANESAATKFNELHQACSAARDAIIAGADKRAVKATPEAVDRIWKRLERGYDVFSLADQLVSENDRIGLSALLQELPDLAHAGKLPPPADGKPNDLTKMVSHAKEAIAIKEQQLYNDAENQTLDDLREVKNVGLIDYNHKQFSKYMEAEARTGCRGDVLHDLVYHWNGLAHDDQPKGVMDINNSDAYASSVVSIA